MRQQNQSVLTSFAPYATALMPSANDNEMLILLLCDNVPVFDLPKVPQEEPKEEEELRSSRGGSWRLEPLEWKILLNSSSLAQEGGDISSLRLDFIFFFSVFFSLSQ